MKVGERRSSGVRTHTLNNAWFPGSLSALEYHEGENCGFTNFQCSNYGAIS